MDNDFDISGLARYLHISPEQVLQLIHREGLPTRRVGGKQVFPRAEIHHWLEDRIGVSSEQELEKLEVVLEKNRMPECEHPETLEEMLPSASVKVPLRSRSPAKIIKEMVELGGESGLLWDSGKMIEAVSAREKLHSTALDGGIALLHPRRPLPSILGDPFVALGRSYQGIPFGGSKGSLTDIFFLICSMNDAGHLKTLARLSRLIGNKAFLGDLRQAETSEELHKVVIAAETELIA
ncbi:MAG: PTS sugar transporter subunit IIA [Pirellulaceae bacterium]|nr:PTS sugar transporter subunit IIA [Pirellulaceae bacterium]